MTQMSDLQTTLFYNGDIYGYPQANALLVERDRIRSIGRYDELRAGLLDGHLIDLNGGCLLPGFIDAHIHLIHTGLVESGWRIDLANRSRAEVLEILAQAATARDGEWVVGYGWDESTWVDRAYLTMEELDRISPHAPLMAIRLDGHLLTVNRKGMERIPAAAPDALIDRKRGLLREGAVSALVNTVKPDRRAMSDALDAVAGLCHRLGITSVHTMSRLEHFEAMMMERSDRKLRITICPEVASFEKLSAVGLKTGYGDPWLRFGGIKIFADGSIGAANAAVSEPFLSGGLGELNHETETLCQWVQKADRSGWQTIIHAIGDRAIEQVIGVHEALGTDASLRHRIEHFELPQRPQLERVKSAGLHLSMQPNFTANWSGSDSLYVDRLGTKRDQLSNPLRLIHDLEIPLAFGSDGMPPSPLYGLHGATQGAYPEQRLTLEEALARYTEGGAYFGFSETETGRLAPGMKADLVVLDEHPLEHPAAIAERTVMMTVVDGEIVYTNGETRTEGRE